MVTRKVSRVGQSPSPLVSFVIPVRDDPVRLGWCLASIVESEYSGQVEVIVADNGSDEASRTVARETGATVIKRPEARVADLRNAGARIARGELLAFVDADHEIDGDWLRHAVAAFDDPSVAAVGATYRSPRVGTWVQRGYDALRARRAGRRAVEWLGSGNLVIRRAVFEAVGGFDSTLHTCEDVDLCRRVRAARWTLLEDDRLVSVHFGDPATLRAVFCGELWRGRDNLRVSLRRPISWRGLPSAFIPIVNLGLIAAAILGAASFSARGAGVAAAATAAFVSLAMLRPLRSLVGRRQLAPGVFGRALAVSCVYDAGRALALVSRSDHRIRRAGG